MKKFEFFLALVCIFSFPMYIVYRVIKYEYFSVNCSSHLLAASRAVNTNIALEQIDKAINYIEKNNLTSGNTGIFYNSIDTDVKYWYTNIKQLRESLYRVPPDSTLAERSLILLRVKQVLVDRKERVISPYDISIHPNVHMETCYFLMSLVLLLTGIWLICIVKKIK